MISLLAALVAVAPVGSLSQGDAGVAAIERAIAAAIAQVPDQQAVPAAKVRDALKAARRRDLQSCDGEPGCLGELGRLVGAQVVISGEAAGLADGRVVYLKAIDAAEGKLLRSTVLVLGGEPEPEAAARAAAYRLLAPDRYVGRLDLKVDVAGAEVFLDGAIVGRAPVAPVTVPVGTHALRVTHPRTRDFVRFIDVRFGEPTEVRADLKAYPIVGDTFLPGGSRPFYKHPAFLAGAVVTVAVVTTILVMSIPRGVERDRDAVVGGMP